MKTILLSSLLFSVSAVTSADSLLPGDADHGKAVHDKSCIACHNDMTSGKPDTIYTRANRRVTSIEGLMGQVNRCNTMQNMGLSEDDTNGITKYLNENFYKFGD